MQILGNIIPVHSHWQLNERYYGELQGKNKAETANIYGDKQIHLWRRSYDVAPPAGESLEDTTNDAFVKSRHSGENRSPDKV